MAYSPCALVVAVATSLVSTFCTDTVAPGRAPWLASTTCPLTVARNSCAVARPATVSSSTAPTSSTWFDRFLIIRILHAGFRTYNGCESLPPRDAASYPTDERAVTGHQESYSWRITWG